MVNNTFGQLLSAHRKRARLTQAEIAMRLNCSRASVSYWERGRQLPNLNQAVRLAQFLGFSLDQVGI